jgi:hypothetical protein
VSGLGLPRVCGVRVAGRPWYRLKREAMDWGAPWRMKLRLPSLALQPIAPRHELFPWAETTAGVHRRPEPGRDLRHLPAPVTAVTTASVLLCGHGLMTGPEPVRAVLQLYFAAVQV